MRALDSLRLRSIRARLLLWYVGVSVLAVAAMGAAAFKLSGQRTERWACSVAEAAVTRAADEVAGRVATCERLSMLLFTDNDLQRYLGMAAVAPQDAWRTYYDFTRRLDTIKRYYPEAYQLTIYVNAPDLPLVGRDLRPMEEAVDQPWYPAMQKAGTRMQFATGSVAGVDRMTYRSKPIPTVLLLRQLYSFDRLKPVGVIRIDMDRTWLFEPVHTARLKGGSVWLEEKDGATIAGARPDRNGPNGQEASLLFDRPVAGTPWRLKMEVPRGAYRAERLEELAVVITVSVFSLLAVAAVSAAVAGSLTRRLRRLKEQAAKVADGDLTVQVADGLPDEIGELSVRLDEMVVELQDLVAENYQRGLAQKEAELRALQAQINPHLLYNTLATVHQMAEEIEAAHIAAAIQALVRYFRYTLAKGADVVRVADEIEQVRAYLEIQNLRFEGRLTYTIEPAPEVLAWETPKLLLQPIVENAILHGLVDLDYQGWIHVGASREGMDLIFTVVDNGKGIAPETLAGLACGSAAGKGGYGVANVRERIQMRYGPGYGVRIEPGAEGGTRVEIRIPAVFR